MTELEDVGIGLIVGLALADRLRAPGAAAGCPVTPRELARARARARRLGMSEDVAPVLPPPPGLISTREMRQAYRELLLALRELDALPPEERAAAIRQVVKVVG